MKTIKYIFLYMGLLICVLGFILHKIPETLICILGAYLCLVLSIISAKIQKNKIRPNRQVINTDIQFPLGDACINCIAQFPSEYCVGCDTYEKLV